MARSSCIRLTDKNFKEEVLDSGKPVFVDFWCSWCPPCKMIEPVIEELAEQFCDVIGIGKLNVDQNPAVRSKFAISAAPTFIIFKNGKVVKRAIGAHSRKQLTQMIESSLSFPGRKQKVVAIAGVQEVSKSSDVLEEV